jgi:hypothetical protein
MNVAPMKVNWSFDTANLQDDFSISGQIKEDFQPKIFPNPAKNNIAAKIPIQTTKTG